VDPKGLNFEKTYEKYDNETEEHISARFGLRYLKDKEKIKKYKKLHAEYPFCKGGSDIFCIGRENLKNFCHFCGIFAASDLFVEIALPTALIMSTKGKLIQEKKIKYRGGYIWGKENVDQFSNDYGYNINDLIERFPPKKLFLHPIKITKWRR